MTATPLPGSVPATATLERAATAPLWRRLLLNPSGAASLGFLVLVVLAGIFADVLAPNDPDTANADQIFADPGNGYLLGGDGSGHDIWSLLLHAISRSIQGAALAVLVAATIGVSAGLISGYYGRWLAGVSSWTANALQVLPGIVVLLAARAVLGPSLFVAMAVFGVLIAPAFYRVVFGAVSAVRNELYVDAARVSGLTDFRIITRHILTVVRAPVIILAANMAGLAIGIQAALDFLGLGELARPTWGGMLNDAFQAIYTAPIQLLWPSLAIALTCMSLALLGNALRDSLERSARPPRKRRTHQTAPPAATADRVDVVTHQDSHPAGADVIVDVMDLAVGYDQPDGSITQVVHDVSLTIRRGEVHGLIGESGSGKTQTAFSIMRLLPAGGQITGGVISFDGVDLAGLSESDMRKLRGRKIAYIPQEPQSNLDPAFTIGHQLVEPMRIVLDIDKAEAKKRALKILDRVGIPDPERVFKSYPHQVSGGMAQRVLIAGAVSCNPDLLIADEPTTALDVTVQAEVLDLLRDLQAEFNMAVLLVTHNFGVVADICDRVSVMQSGRIVETGRVDEIFNNPLHSYTRSLFDAILEDTQPRGPLSHDAPNLHPEKELDNA